MPPFILSLSSTRGPTSGGDLVRIEGGGFNPRVQVRLGGELVQTLAILSDAALEIQTPAHEAGRVDVEVTRLTAAGIPVPGERAVFPNSYGYERPAIVREADLTRAIRQLLRELKRQVITNVSAAVSVDYDDSAADGPSIVAMAKLPSLVITGPSLRQNRFYSANVPQYDVVGTPEGLQAIRRRPPLTVDLVFGVTAASSRTAELFNLMGAVATFLNRNRWLELPRDPADNGKGAVRWELDADGEFHTQLASRDDVRVFTCGLVIRGFDVDEGLPFDLARLVNEPVLETGSFP